MEFSELVRLAYPTAYLTTLFGEKANQDRYRVFVPSARRYLGNDWVTSKEIAWRNAWDLPRTQYLINQQL